jgi:hypothetical protein
MPGHMTRTLVLLPGMDGTGDLFDDFVAALPQGTAFRIGRYPTREFLNYSQLDAFVQALTKDLGPFVESKVLCGVRRSKSAPTTAPVMLTITIQMNGK